MSLRVWLPLTKDLRNQGLDEVEIINYGATFDSEGKLGGCYYFDGIDDRIVINDLVLPNIWSYSCWIYSATSSRGWEAVIMLNSTGGDADLQLGFYTYPAGNRIQNTANGQYSSGISWTYGMWHHFCGTFNGSSLKTYIDGILVDTKNITASLLTKNHLTIGARCNNSTNTSASVFFQGKLNDVRIYDHCLSPMEVKEISKGLVLHYPLSDKYLESTTNIITSEDCLSATCYNGALGKYSYGSNTDMYKEVTYFEGRKGTKVYNKTNGTSMLPYVYINKLFTSNGTNASEYKTLSFDYYTTISTALYPYKLGAGSGTASYKVINNEIKTGIGTNSVSIPVKPEMWNHIEITFQGTTDANAEWGYMQNQPTHNSNTSNFWFFANMQIEEKDHATGYAGVGKTRTDTIIYDTSGYGNNGEIYAYDSNGKIEITSDTPKYNISTHIISSNTATSSAAGTTYLYGHCQLTNPNQMTVAFWCKPIKGYNNSTTQGQFCTTAFEFNNQSVGADYQYSAMNHRDGTVDINDSSSTTQCRPHINFIPNEWHHYVITYDGQNGSTYQDGVLYEVKSFESPKQLDSFIGIVIGFSKAGGVWRKNDSYYSDFRIYATALSAEDVKSLYNNSAYIDNQGNIYGAVYEEV